ncbi:helix-turn-helix domain-containing protein [Pedobacter sp. L105]|uniref:helix-turn-helix domain-containing protein n=1 Tax=Pedobacter sp. L105 TaxID=1641871 RepID=UPI00131EA342|nr:helix-turn-helix domain-containing protein [Pedobacter sp. L105]
MSVEIITKEDLDRFKVDLLKEIKQMLSATPGESKRWLKNSEVRKMLSISSGKLQMLRVNNTLPYTKIGGTMYYKFEDIVRMLEGKS